MVIGPTFYQESRRGMLSAGPSSTLQRLPGHDGDDEPVVAGVGTCQLDAAVAGGLLVGQRLVDCRDGLPDLTGDAQTLPLPEQKLADHCGGDGLLRGHTPPGFVASRARGGPEAVSAVYVRLAFRYR
jgi:hypothetical protein